eukprot:878192-Pyramimonas_sp.AAC.1
MENHHRGTSTAIVFGRAPGQLIPGSRGHRTPQNTFDSGPAWPLLNGRARMYRPTAGRRDEPERRRFESEWGRSA